MLSTCFLLKSRMSFHLQSTSLTTITTIVIILTNRCSWTGYSGMLRTFKNYNNPFRATSTKAAGSTFSGYPGVLVSGDDYYITTRYDFSHRVISVIITITTPYFCHCHHHFHVEFFPGAHFAWQQPRCDGNHEWCDEPDLVQVRHNQDRALLDPRVRRKQNGCHWQSMGQRVLSLQQWNVCDKPE